MSLISDIRVDIGDDSGVVPSGVGSHELLSVSHSDTIVGSPSTAALIVGGSPWQVLPSGAEGYVLSINAGSIVWTSGVNGTGAAGPAGPAGPSGIDGAAGPSGIDGAAGPSGIDGAAGPSGVAGIDGAAGATGPAGPSGIDGAAGAIGPSGVAGASGTIGPIGLPSPIISAWDATAGISPSINFSTLDSRGIHHVLDYDDTTDETCYFRGVVPTSYASGNNILLDIHWAASSATLGDVLWKFRIDRIDGGGQSLDGTSWTTYINALASTANGSNGKLSIASFTLNHSEFDFVSPGDVFIMEVGRDADSSGSGTDNMVGDAELLKAIIMWP